MTTWDHPLYLKDIPHQTWGRIFRVAASQEPPIRCEGRIEQSVCLRRLKDELGDLPGEGKISLLDDDGHEIKPGDLETLVKAVSVWLHPESFKIRFFPDNCLVLRRGTGYSRSTCRLSISDTGQVRYVIQQVQELQDKQRAEHLKKEKIVRLKYLPIENQIRDQARVLLERGFRMKAIFHDGRYPRVQVVLYRPGGWAIAAPYDVSQGAPDLGTLLALAGATEGVPPARGPYEMKPM